ncbi:HAD family hydrolase [Pseudomonas japonica]|uniref:HAD family hydrolase n=1 Tax=Pseudomonas japonica TaxID=256466 RepID=UPI0015E36810|nr:HAD family hydrolase [Pseudomonas japonica]MBA1288776.1 haloacid dehalogenase [Pseudomonas japonica]
MMIAGCKSQVKSEMNVTRPFQGYKDFLAAAEKAAVVSFDFFDTLYIRPLARPEDAFDIIAKKNGIPNFRSMRRAAQTEAFRRMIEAGRREITLEGIYACLPYCGTPASVLMQEEYDLELALVEPNPEVMEVFLELRKRNKTVVITSDMYLPERFFKAALRPYGLDTVPLFISSDCNATKRDDGELFRVLAKQLSVPIGDVLHIGDNELGDVVRPKEAGLAAFHYRASMLRTFNKGISLATSVAYGLLSTKGRSIPAKSFTEIGFVYGGTANLAFMEWIKEAALKDKIDHVLFLSRDGYSLEKMTADHWGDEYPRHSYFLGSRTAYTLASINTENFAQFIPFLMSGADGLAPFELLERIGVRPPSKTIMAQLGLGADVVVGALNHAKVISFLYAYRWEILKVCRRNRIALHRYLKQQGLQDGSRIALVDVGWSGTTQEAFERAIKPLMNLEVHGYYLCLADTPERLRRSAVQRMSALISSGNTAAQIVSKIYTNRVSIEMLFSAPHPSVIGLEIVNGIVEPVFDRGRGGDPSGMEVAAMISDGIDAFAHGYKQLLTRFEPHLSQKELIAPIFELIDDKSSIGYRLLSEVKAFDAWGSSANHKFSVKDYI